MDHKFPNQQFPQFYVDGGPEVEVKHDYGGWGSYGQLLETSCDAAQCGTDRPPEFQFLPRHKVEGELWIPTEPIVTPLLPPNYDTKVFTCSSVSPEDLPDQMQYFYIHHYRDSFSTMGQLLGKHFNFGKHIKKKKGKPDQDFIAMGTLKNFMHGLGYKKCELGHSLGRVHRYHNLLGDVMHDVPPGLLAELLREELNHQRSMEYFQPGFTGGVLALVPVQDDQNEVCLVYPGAEALNSINFHKVVLQHTKDKPPTFVLDDKPLTWDLNGSLRQVSVARVHDEAYLGLRSDHFGAALVMSEGEGPRSLEVVQLQDRSTCITVSPHIPGELLIAGEGGAVHLWTVGRGLQKIRVEQTNLYFNAMSSWRWCEFTAHPRVMVYADRTGVELTDSRSSDSHTLFRIGRTAGCKSGERVFLSRYIGESHAYHHLITTQFSAYIMDERMPLVPPLKWEHMMEFPPCFSHVVPQLDLDGTSKILLGSQRGQETVLLQYSGGREWPCQSQGPVQKLSSPCESLKLHQLPHKQRRAENRVSVPAAGLAAIQRNGFMCVFQLTEAGDMFYQVLRHYDAYPSAEEPTFRISSAVSEEDMGEQVQDENPDQEAVPQGPTEASDRREGVTSGPASGSGSSLPSCAPKLEIPEQASPELKVIWKVWLDHLLTKSTAKKPCVRHWRIKSKDVMKLTDSHTDWFKDKFRSLAKDLRETMKNRKLLTHGLTNLPKLSVTPVPDMVDPLDWADDLSQRLDVSWTNGWDKWWEEKLGLNKEAKIRALRRRRLQEKRARSRNRTALSGSFTSSVSYQDDLSDCSVALSWSQASDAESIASRISTMDDFLSDLDHENVANTVQSTGLSETIQARKDVVDITPSKPCGPSRQLEASFLGSSFNLQEPSQDISLDKNEGPSTSQLSNTSFAPWTLSPLRISTQESQPQISSDLDLHKNTTCTMRSVAFPKAKHSLKQNQQHKPTEDRVNDQTPTQSRIQKHQTGLISAHKLDLKTTSQKSVLDSKSPKPQVPLKQMEQNYLGSLFGSQDPSQDIGQDKDDGPSMSQLSNSSLAPWTLSQLRNSTRASQPKKKRPRMGF